MITTWLRGRDWASKREKGKKIKWSVCVGKRHILLCMFKKAIYSIITSSYLRLCMREEEKESKWLFWGEREFVCVCLCGCVRDWKEREREYTPSKIKEMAHDQGWSCIPVHNNNNIRWLNNNNNFRWFNNSYFM